jgi:hypothetical protein
MTFVQAAALPQAGQLAVQGLFGPYPLSEGPDALRHFGTGNHKGKVIITMD